jgi:hypothetical protein
MIDFDYGSRIDNTALLTQHKGVVRKRLTDLHNTGLSWPRIAALPQYLPIPYSTLYSISKGGSIPKKWWGILGYRPNPRPPRIAISLKNPESAARSIQKNMEPEVMAELIELLNER